MQPRLRPGAIPHAVQRLHAEHIAVAVLIGENPGVGDTQALEVLGDQSSSRPLKWQPSVDYFPSVQRVPLRP
jgi:hypothetical protein